jgi:hypothetical protein
MKKLLTYQQNQVGCSSDGQLRPSQPRRENVKVKKKVQIYEDTYAGLQYVATRVLRENIYVWLWNRWFVVGRESDGYYRLGPEAHR